MKNKLQIFKAELSMKVARFIAQNHSNPLSSATASLLSRLNRARYGQGALEFLNEEDSIDHLDYSECDEKR